MVRPGITKPTNSHYMMTGLGPLGPRFRNHKQSLSSETVPAVLTLYRLFTVPSCPGSNAERKLTFCISVLVNWRPFLGLAETKCRHFRDDIFKYIFFEWKLSYFDSDFTEICSQWSNWQYSTIGSDNSLAPNRRPPIIWTNDVLVYWRTYASFGLNRLCLPSLSGCFN